MQYVILVRKPNGNVTALMDGDEIATFTSETAAQLCADHQILCKAQPYQIVELDQL